MAFTTGHYGRIFAMGKARSGILPPLVQVKQPFDWEQLNRDRFI